jgi:hypothetical protein
MSLLLICFFLIGLAFMVEPFYLIYWAKPFGIFPLACLPVLLLANFELVGLCGYGLVYLYTVTIKWPKWAFF